MHKCRNCGTEFEGKFCYECGTEWKDKKNCPECGTTVGVSMRFCPECGHAFDEETKSVKSYSVDKNDENRLPKTSVGNKNTFSEALYRFYAVVRYVPIALYVLFALLVFAFYAAPVACVNDPFLGGSYSFGNVYNISDVFPELSDAISALIVFAIIFAVLSVSALILCIVPKIKNKIAIKNFTFGEVATWSAFIAYLFYIIMGISVMVEVAHFDDMGVIVSGSMPTLVLVFGIVFAVLTACSYIIRCVLGNIHPEFKCEAEKRAQQKRIAEYARLEEFYKTHNEPIAPAVPQVSLDAYPSDQRRNYKREWVYYKHKKRMYDKGRDGEPASAILWLDANKIFVGIVSALLVIGIILTCALVPIFTNIFRLGKVEKIQIGDTQAQVREVLGSPYKPACTDAIWRYFDDDYADVLERLEENAAAQKKSGMGSGDMSGLIQEQERLNERLSTLTYKYIEIRYKDNKAGQKVVSSVLFDNERQDKKPNKKQVSDSKLVNAEFGYVKNSMKGLNYDIAIDNSNDKMHYDLSFADGSFYRSADMHYTYVLENKNGVVDVSWTDAYGSYKKNVQATLAGSLGVGGVWRESDADIPYTYKDNIKYLGNILIEAVDKKIVSAKIDADTQIIAAEAFSGCSSICEITLHDNIKGIGNSAFYDCKNILIFCEPAEKPNEWSNVWTFGDCRVIWDYKNNDVSTDGKAYALSDGIKYVIENGEAKIIKANELKSDNLVIPSTVTSCKGTAYPVKAIAANVFRNCSSLTSITIPDSVTSIGDSAFDGCPIETATIPAYACSHIKNSALKTVVITSGDSIGNYAFS